MSACFRPINPSLWLAFSQSEQRILPCLQQRHLEGELPQRLATLAQHVKLLAADIAIAGQPLLQEWLLRRWLFLLAHQALATDLKWQRQVLLDQLYQPLLELYPLYRQYKDGAARQFALQAELQRLFSLWAND